MSALIVPAGPYTELDVSSRGRAEQCVGMSGSLVNRVRKSNRVVGGAVHHCASRGASERIQDWVLGGRAADTDRRSFGARRPHALRSQQHTTRAEPPGERGAQQRCASVRGLPSTGTRRALERGCGRYTGSGNSHRASEVRGHPTCRRYQYVRDQVQYLLGEKRERHEKTKKRSTELDNCGHIEGLWCIQMKTWKVPNAVQVK